MAYTAEDLAAVEEAIVNLATGTREIEIAFSAGYRVKYHEATLDELLKLKAIIQQDTSTTFRARTYAKNGGRG